MCCYLTTASSFQAHNDVLRFRPFWRVVSRSFFFLGVIPLQKCCASLHTNHLSLVTQHSGHSSCTQLAILEKLRDESTGASDSDIQFHRQNSQRNVPVCTNNFAGKTHLIGSGSAEATEALLFMDRCSIILKGLYPLVHPALVNASIFVLLQSSSMNFTRSHILRPQKSGVLPAPPRCKQVMASSWFICRPSDYACHAIDWALSTPVRVPLPYVEA